MKPTNIQPNDEKQEAEREDNDAPDLKPSIYQDNRIIIQHSSVSMNAVAPGGSVSIQGTIENTVNSIKQLLYPLQIEQFKQLLLQLQDAIATKPNLPNKEKGMEKVQALAKTTQCPTSAMKYLHYPIKTVTKDCICVTLDKQANVKLMDALNFQKYRQGKSHRYYGGYATKSPIKLTPPCSGNWHVTIDLGGYAGSASTSVAVV